MRQAEIAARPLLRNGDLLEFVPSLIATQHSGSGKANQSLTFLQQHFGKSGPWYYAIARGEDHRPVNGERVRKSSGPETTFETNLTDPAAIVAEVLALADKVWGWCETAQAFGRTVTAKIKFADFQQATRSRSAPGAVADREHLRRLGRDLIGSVLPSPKGIRLVGVTVSNFQAAPVERLAQPALIG
ncbi:hypothetical protein [Caulobacter sp. DWR1-3-2b1]|uniref:DinB/UmuC family translesion DNA polymerase n=1 Tax=Caulobacter sp. DWR1-3-2b1 TaxID=2804670 RepID=UPI003CECE157